MNEQKKNAIRVGVTSVASVICSYLATWIYEMNSERIIGFLNPELVNEKTALIIRVIFWVISVFLIFIVSILLNMGVNRLFENIWPELEYNRSVYFAYLKLREMMSKKTEILEEGREKETQVNIMNNIKLATESCYEFFEERYSSKEKLLKDIKFETSFMTLSYRDKKITIPFACNYERKNPNSMHLRENNPDIYDGTETDKIYKEFESGQTPLMHLIEDVCKNKDYKELYNSEKSRIRSTVISPVLSHKNELLGTLVVHCNKSNFFKEKDYAYWDEILKIFSSEIGFQKLSLDLEVNKAGSKLPF